MIKQLTEVALQKRAQGFAFSWYSLRRWIKDQAEFDEDNQYHGVDPEEYLDSPIVDLEWGQPVFLDRR